MAFMQFEFHKFFTIKAGEDKILDATRNALADSLKLSQDTVAISSVRDEFNCLCVVYEMPEGQKVDRKLALAVASHLHKSLEANLDVISGSKNSERFRGLPAESVPALLVCVV